MISIIVISALLLDLILGEPRKYHPLVGFGKLANWLEKHINTNHDSHTSLQPSF